VLHNGFNDSEFLYCSSCHRVAILNIYSQRSKLLLELGKQGLWRWRESQPAKDKIEAALSSCPEGGRFTFEASPRCPLCSAVLSVEATVQELHAGEWWGTAGWRGIYCLEIEGGGIVDLYT
jgi:hypothetical protein